MHIKELTICGFRSYREPATVGPLSKGLNVVVGKNGSGKSNFFAAIRFVLNDAYIKLSPEERLALIHDVEYTGTHIEPQAWVEIIFDNADGRIPTGRPETIIRRTITSQSDEMMLDKRTISKTELSNLLQAAGFSKSNPYYIVPQGRITALTNARNEERLALIKEIAGTTLYEAHREESLRILNDSTNKAAKVAELLEEIAQRHQELNDQQQKALQAEEDDQRRRAIEYTLLAREQAEIQDALGADATTNTAENAENERLRYELEATAQEAVTQQERLMQAQQLCHLLLSQQQNIVRERREQLAAMDGNIPIFSSSLESLEKEYASLEQQRAMRETELEKCNHMLMAYKIREAALRRRIAAFNSPSLSSTDSIQTLQDPSETDKNYSSSSILAELKEAENQLSTALEAAQAAKSASTQLSATRRSLWQEEAKLRTLVPALQEQMLALERELFTLSPDRATALGLAALRKLVVEHGLENSCLGPLYELITVNDPIYEKAVDVVVGARLFHVVVDTSDHAAVLVEALRKEGLGRLTFIPLDRISASKENTFPNPSEEKHLNNELQGNDEVIAMASVINVRDPRLEPLIRSIFGRHCIASSLKVSGKWKEVVTLDGDRRDSRGALTGGYIDQRRSRLPIVRALVQLRDERLGPTLSTLARLENEIERIERAIATQAALQTQEETIAKRVSATVNELKSRLNNLQHNMEDEQAAEFMDINKEPIDSDEEMRAASLSLEEAKAELLKLTVGDAEREALVIQRERLRQELEVRIQGRLQTLSSFLIPDAKRQTTLAEIDQRNSMEERKLAIEALEEAIRTLDEMRAENEKNESELARIAQVRENAERQLQELREQTSASWQQNSRHAALRARLAEIDRKIRECGHIPSILLEPLRSLSSAALRQQAKKKSPARISIGLDVAHIKEQLEMLSQQRKTLLERQQELHASKTAIESYITTLDCQKDAVVMRTYDTISTIFSQLFTEMVPNGSASLVLERNEEQWIGIEVVASFISGAQPVPTVALSGGQKSMVACCLILAIQQTDPAPFYLFDEIDANLDAQYRAAIASSIRRLADDAGAQFVVTTFRPELATDGANYFGVTMGPNRASRIQGISREHALEFITDAPNQ